MRKRLIMLFAFVLFSFFFTECNVEAASWSISPRSVSIKTGGSVSIKISGNVAGRFDISTSGSCRANVSKVFKETISSNASFSVTANGSGSCSVNVSAGDVTDSSYNSVGGSSSAKLTITSSSNSSASKNSNTSRNNNSSNKTDSKSSNNALKSLSIEGQKISPDFDKDKTDYSLTVPNETKTVKINAEASDSKSTITGTGEKEVKEGDNKFEVVVTAENGDKKTYTINVKVDTKPIIVKINGKEFTVIKNRDELPELDLEKEETTLNIDEQDVPAYRIDKLNCILIGLKDEDGKIRYYIFNSYKDKEKPVEYTLFRELTFPKIFISYLDFPEKLIPEGYNKYKIKIGEEEVDIYKKTKKSRFGLFYGVNIETGEKNIYKYDSKENTVQVYSNEDEQELKEKIETGLYIVVGLIGLSSLLLLIIVILLVTRKKLKKKIINKLQKQLNN